MWTTIRSLVLGGLFGLWGAIPLLAQPGNPIAATSAVSDQKLGSILIFNYYTSSTVNASRVNTRVSLTNTHTTENVEVHLFLVSGANSTQTDFFVCLSPNQTNAFLASDIDPGTTGYIVAVAVGATGCPISFNYLIGDEYVKLGSGHAASFGAEAIAALYTGTLPGCGGQTATLNFDGVSYNALPRQLMMEKIRSSADNNSMLLVVNRIGGNLNAGPISTLGTVTGDLFNEAGTAHSFSFTRSQIQFVSLVTDSFPLTTPLFSSVIPATQTGWMRLAASTDSALFGVAINLHTGSAPAAAGGHHLRVLSLTTAASLVMPIYPPNC